jgi:gamma-glutamylcyclotransferase (GGCT)/AIG2-like uncharacterized protein YtfP
MILPDLVIHAASVDAMTVGLLERLFVYGTLCDAQVQRALFNRELPSESAMLEGWAVYRSTSDGFLFIKPSHSDMVVGQVLLLTPDELDIADAWEDVPLYLRERVSVISGGVAMTAWTYTRRADTGTKHEDSTTSGHDREQVIEWARQLRAAMSSSCKTDAGNSRR